MHQATALDYAFARQSLAAATAHTWYLAIETRQLVDSSRQSVEFFNEAPRPRQGEVRRRQRLGARRGRRNRSPERSASGAGARARALQRGAAHARFTRGQVPIGRIGSGVELCAAPSTRCRRITDVVAQRRPDILAAESQVVAAFRALELAPTPALLPNIVLTADGGRLSNKILYVLTLNPYLIGAGFGLFQPIFEGGALRTEIQDRISTAGAGDP